MLALTLGPATHHFLPLATHVLNLALWMALGYWAYRLARWVRRRRQESSRRQETRQRPGG